MEERLKRLKAIDTEQKLQTLICLQQALWVFRVYARLRYEPDKELVRITWHSDRPETVVNVGLDNGSAMLYDIFRQAGKSQGYKNCPHIRGNGRTG